MVKPLLLIAVDYYKVLLWEIFIPTCVPHPGETICIVETTSFVDVDKSWTDTVLFDFEGQYFFVFW